jgi:hypothetical protein
MTTNKTISNIGDRKELKTANEYKCMSLLLTEMTAL